MQLKIDLHSYELRKGDDGIWSTNSIGGLKLKYATLDELVAKIIELEYVKNLYDIENNDLTIDQLKEGMLLKLDLMSDSVRDNDDIDNVGSILSDLIAFFEGLERIENEKTDVKQIS
jgi:hypothetical protein